MKRTLRQEGFTFNEVLVAMNIIVIAVMGYSLSSVSVIRGQAENDHFAIAMHLAQDKLEQLKSQSSPPDENSCPESGERGLSALGAAGGIFDRCWRVADSPLGRNLKQIEVVVSWRDYQARQVALSTLLYRESGS